MDVCTNYPLILLDITPLPKKYVKLSKGLSKLHFHRVCNEIEGNFFFSVWVSQVSMFLFSCMISKWPNSTVSTPCSTPLLCRDFEKGYESAVSSCASKGGHVVEINSKAEFKFLKKISKGRRFLLGAKKDLKTGLWHWETTGEEIDTTRFQMHAPGNAPNELNAFMRKESYHLGKKNRSPCSCL